MKKLSFVIFILILPALAFAQTTYLGTTTRSGGQVRQYWTGSDDSSASITEYPSGTTVVRTTPSFDEQKAQNDRVHRETMDAINRIGRDSDQD